MKFNYDKLLGRIIDVHEKKKILNFQTRYLFLN